MKCPPDCTCGKHRRQQLVEDSASAAPEPELKMIYHERGHRYYLNGTRTKSVSAVAKIAADDYKIRLWNERMVAIGLTVEPEGRVLRENIAMHIDDSDALEDDCEQAKRIAQAHWKADRGSQKHRVLELVLTGQEHRLVTDQQRADAVILKRTLDRYRLIPRTELAEQFIVYPEYYITGRFDAVLVFETADGRTVLVDLKSGINAIKYPHSTGAQLAMYDNAPLISIGENRGSRIEITEWSTMPASLDHSVAYVLLVENNEQVGTLHEINIEHGWKAAQWAMDLVVWRKELNYGNDMVREVPDRFTAVQNGEIAATFIEMAARAISRKECKVLARNAADQGCFTPELRDALNKRWTETT